MLTKDGRNVSVEALTPENYPVPAGEEKVYHIVQEIKQFDSKTGRKLSKARVQKYGRKIFEKVVRDQLMKQGYDFRILHDPTAYLAEQSAKASAAAASKKAAEKEKFDAAVAAAVEKALAAKEAEKKGKTKKGE